MESLKEIKIEIGASLVKALEHLEEARAKVRSNVLTEENPYGLLTRGEEKYLRCLDLNLESFKNLIRQDEAHWA